MKCLQKRTFSQITTMQLTKSGNSILIYYDYLIHTAWLWRWFSGKESACKAGDVGSIPGLGRSHGEGHGILEYSCLGNPMDRGAWWTTVPRVTKESDRTLWLSKQTKQSTLHIWMLKIILIMLYSCFFPDLGSNWSLCVLFSCHIYLVSFNLDQFQLSFLLWPWNFEA